MNTAAERAPDARWLLRAAQQMIEHRSAAPRAWPRAAALLGRQALETAIIERFPELRRASGRARNLCLPALLGDDTLARELADAWGALSHATHHHAYDLPPTADELGAWLEPIGRLLAGDEAGA